MNYIINKEEEYQKVLGEELYENLEDYGFDFYGNALVVKGNVEIDLPFIEYIKKLKEEAEEECVSIIFTDNVIVNNLIELDGTQIIVLGKMEGQSFIETDENYFYGKEVEIKNFTTVLFPQGCIYFDSLETPVLFASENFPIIENLKGDTNIFSENSEDFIEGSMEGNVSFYDLDSSDTYNDDFLKQFKISEDYTMYKVFTERKEEIIKFLNNSVDILNQ